MVTIIIIIMTMITIIIIIKITIWEDLILVYEVCAGIHYRYQIYVLSMCSVQMRQIIVKIRWGCLINRPIYLDLVLPS